VGVQATNRLRARRPLITLAVRKHSKFAICSVLGGSRARDIGSNEEFLNSNDRLKIIDSARPGARVSVAGSPGWLVI